MLTALIKCSKSIGAINYKIRSYILKLTVKCDIRNLWSKKSITLFVSFVWLCQVASVKTDQFYQTNEVCDIFIKI